MSAQNVNDRCWDFRHSAGQDRRGINFIAFVGSAYSSAKDRHLLAVGYVISIRNRHCSFEPTISFQLQPGRGHQKIQGIPVKRNRYGLIIERESQRASVRSNLLGRIVDPNVAVKQGFYWMSAFVFWNGKWTGDRNSQREIAVASIGKNDLLLRACLAGNCLDRYARRFHFLRME